MPDLFAKPAPEIVGEAIERFRPIRIFVGFSGGSDSLALVHWMMNNVDDCELFHINTGIGIAQTREFVRDTCAAQRWPLHEIRALEDCGQSYEWIVRKFGFPGPAHHHICYRRLKERGIALLVRRTKTKRADKIILATGIREDESIIRAGYKDREINQNGAQVWVNPIYWWPKAQRDAYLAEQHLEINPVSRRLGISGECLCGAFAQPGELDRVRDIDPAVAARIDTLANEVRERFPWGWEERPPRPPVISGEIGPLCIGCEKSAVVQAELFADNC